MELKIVVTPKLLEEAIISLMENKFNVKVSEATIIISESCNFTDNSGVTVNLTIGEKPINYPVMLGTPTADEVWRKKAARYIAEEPPQNPEGLNPYFKPVTETDEWRRNREVPKHDGDLGEPPQNPEGLNAQKYASTTNPL